MTNKKIRILGTGQVAKILAAVFVKYGYDVIIGSRDATKLKDWQQSFEMIKLGTYGEAARLGETIALAVKASWPKVS